MRNSVIVVKQLSGNQVIMKLIVFFSVAVVLASAKPMTDEQKAKLMEIHKECLDVSGVDEALAAKAQEGEFPDDDKFKDHLFCISKKIGFQDDAGEIQVDVVREKMKGHIQDDAKVEEIISKCAHAKETPQQTAYETMKCYKEMKKAAGAV